MEKLNYKGWPNSYRLSNGLVDLVVTTDVGPRIIRFGFIGEENEFKEYESMLGKVGGDEWRIYGGHRLWHAPEAMPRTYFPDNGSVQLETYPDFVRLIQPVEMATGIQKEMDIRFSREGPHVQVTHRLCNTNCWAVELAPWALSVMAPGGTGIIPLPPRGAHAEFLTPLSTIALWAYTDMADPRYTWSSKYILLRQDPRAKTHQKIGAMVPDGWIAYARNGHLFLVRFDYVPGVPYPDLGCSAEIFTDAEMLEIETLGPLVRLQPGAAVEHTEYWFLFRDVPVPQDDADVDEHILPKVQIAQTTDR
nr:hypothetical protein [Chloroflexota bacterium]